MSQVRSKQELDEIRAKSIKEWKEQKQWEKERGIVPIEIPYVDTSKMSWKEILELTDDNEVYEGPITLEQYEDRERMKRYKNSHKKNKVKRGKLLKSYWQGNHYMWHCVECGRGWEKKGVAQECSVRGHVDTYLDYYEQEFIAHLEGE